MIKKKKTAAKAVDAMDSRRGGGGRSVTADGALGLDDELHLAGGAVEALALAADEVVHLALLEDELEARAGALGHAGHQLGRLEVAGLVVGQVPHHVHAVRVLVAFGGS